MEIVAIIVAVALILAVVVLVSSLRKPDIMKVVYSGKSWFVGQRGNKEIGVIPHEGKGTHHFTVLEGVGEFKELVGREIAIPIDNAKYFVLNWKDARENKDGIKN